MANAPAWHEAYPAPRNTSPSVMERKDLLAHLQGGKRPGVDFVVVDLRKNDYEGGTIKGSINLPAQSLYPSLPTLLALWEAAGVKQVIWYCGSSQGRGTRAAGWLDDLIKDRDVKGVSSLILRGGIKGWVSAGDEYTTLMEGYDPHVWTSQK